MSARAARHARLLSKLAPHTRPAWRPQAEPGDELDASKLGGTPIAGANVDTAGLRMLVQLRSDDLPEELGFPAGQTARTAWKISSG